MIDLVIAYNWSSCFYKYTKNIDILNCQIKLEKTTFSFVIYLMNTSSGVL